MTPTVWVTGCRGMLGQTITASLQRRGIACVGSDSRLAIDNPEALATFCREHRPTHVVNCAAYTLVDQCESEPEKARAANAVGPGVVSELACNFGMTAVHVSTDYVFDGTACAPYVEEHATNPLGVYGRTKRDGELAFLRNPRGIVVRTSWLFGPGRNFVDTMLKLMMARQELRVVADQKGRPTACIDLAEGILQLAGLSPLGAAAPGGVYHVANSGIASWHELAAYTLTLARGLRLPVVTSAVTPIASEQFPTPARRPMYSVLDTQKFERQTGHTLRHWHEAVASYVSDWARLHGARAASA